MSHVNSRTKYNKALCLLPHGNNNYNQNILALSHIVDTPPLLDTTTSLVYRAKRSTWLPIQIPNRVSSPHIHSIYNNHPYKINTRYIITITPIFQSRNSSTIIFLSNRSYSGTKFCFIRRFGKPSCMERHTHKRDLSHTFKLKAKYLWINLHKKSTLETLHLMAGSILLWPLHNFQMPSETKQYTLTEIHLFFTSQCSSCIV